MGSDFALINVQISDRPDPPRWPQTSQIGTDSLVLEWQSPQWDGGSAITNYVVEKQDELIDTQKKLIDSQTITVEMKGDNF